MSENKVYKPVKETAKYFLCGDCGKPVYQSVCDGICRGIGPSFAFQASLHRCSSCLRKIAQDNGVFNKLIEDTKQKFNSEIVKK